MRAEITIDQEERERETERKTDRHKTRENESEREGKRERERERATGRDERETQAERKRESDRTQYVERKRNTRDAATSSGIAASRSKQCASCSLSAAHRLLFYISRVGVESQSLGSRCLAASRSLGFRGLRRLYLRVQPW